MSRATKRKHVVRELLEERVRPADRQTIVRVLGTPGNNLHEVETPEGTRFLVSMPPRFRKHVWIKRGDFLLVDPIPEGVKVKAEMSLVLLPPHVRSLQRQGLWPEAFDPPGRDKGPPRPPGDNDNDSNGLFVNTNRGDTSGDTSDTSGDTSDTSDTGDTSDSDGDTDGDTGDNGEDTEDNGDAGDNGDTEDTRDNKDTGDTAPRDTR